MELNTIVWIAVTFGGRGASMPCTVWI